MADGFKYNYCAYTDGEIKQMSINFSYPQINEGQNVLPHYIYSTMKKLNGGFIIVITGGRGIKTGTGKSYTAMRLGELIDPSFDASKMCITPVQFLKKLKDIENSKIPYQVVVLDETEIAASNRQSMSLDNKLIDFSMMIVRNVKCLVIFVTPQLNFIDKHLRSLAAYWGMCRKVTDRTGKTKVKMRFYKVTTDPFSDSIFYNKIRFYDPALGRVVVGQEYTINLPSQELIDSYEENITKYKSKLRDEFLAQAEDAEKNQFSKSDMSRSNFKELAVKAYADPQVKEFLLENKKITDGVLLSLYDIPPTQARVLARVINQFYRRDNALLPATAK